jgi:uncharacterized membrane protein
MKNTIVAVLFLCFMAVSAQVSTSEICKIAAAERNSAKKKMNLEVNSNTQNYDITYHKLEFNVDPAIYFISGKITTTYTALANMNTLTFDLSNTLIVSSVKINNVSLAYTQNTNELIITLPTTQLLGTQATVEVIYSGAPPQNGFFEVVRQKRLLLL